MPPSALGSEPAAFHSIVRVSPHGAGDPQSIRRSTRSIEAVEVDHSHGEAAGFIGGLEVLEDGAGNGLDLFPAIEAP